MKTSRLSQRIDPDLLDQVRAEARRTGLSAAAVVTLALNAYFALPVAARDSKRPAGQKATSR